MLRRGFHVVRLCGEIYRGLSMHLLVRSLSLSNSVCSSASLKRGPFRCADADAEDLLKGSRGAASKPSLLFSFPRIPGSD